MDSHDRAVAVIAATVETYYARKEPFRIYHGSTNSTRQSPYQRNLMVDTSALSNIIRIETKSRTALCEPNVPVRFLSSHFLPPSELFVHTTDLWNWFLSIDYYAK